MKLKLLIIYFSNVCILKLWLDVREWLFPKILHLESFSQKDIIYGLVTDNYKDDFLVNNILILGKFFIHKSKYMKVKPRFGVFHNEFLSYIKALKLMKNKNVVELFSIEEYDFKK